MLFRSVVIEGVFQGSEGTVTAVDDERLRLTIEAMVFDRMTPIELEFRQVEAAEQ